MQIRNWLASALLGSCALLAASAHADTVLYDSAGFIQGQQSYVQSFLITTPGTLTVTLSEIPWLDTIADLNCFLSTASSTFGQPMGPGTEAMSVSPGTFYAHWFGEATGTYGAGVYGIEITFQPAAAVVGLPASIVFLLSGLGALLAWRREKMPGEVPSNDKALTI